MNQDDIDLTIEILVLGQSSVGKTNLITRYVSDSFQESSRPTIGNDYFRSIRYYNDLKTFVKFWDTAGQERFNAMTSTFYNNADAVILVYDITNRESFEKVSYWLEEVQTNCKKPISIMLVGNKNDLLAERKIPTIEALNMAKLHDMLFFETSAKTNEDDCVGLAFQSLIEEKVCLMFNHMADEQGVDVENLRKQVVELHQKKAEQSKKGCC